MSADEASGALCKLIAAVTTAKGLDELTALHTLVQRVSEAIDSGALPAQVQHQRCLDELMAYAMDRLYGSSERLGVDAPLAARHRASIDMRSPSLGVTISGLLKQLIELVQSLPLSSGLIQALVHSASHTTKPVVRQNTFTFLFDWIKRQLKPQANEGLFLETAAGPVAAAAASGGVQVTGPIEFSILKSAMVLGLTDVWSAIRKGCAKRLFALVDMLPMSLVEELYSALINVAVAPETHHNSWRCKEGALLGMAMVVKRFRRSGSGEHHAGTSSGIAGSASSRRRRSPALAPIPASPREPAAGHASFQARPSHSIRRSVSDRVVAPPSLPSPRLSLSKSVDMSSSPRVVLENHASPAHAHAHASRAPHAFEAATEAAMDASVADPEVVLLFGRSLRCTLPRFISLRMRNVVYPLLAHPQLSVRENAIRLFASFLVRCDSTHTIRALKEVLNMLRGEGVAAWEHSGTPLPPSPDSGPLERVLEPYCAEGVLGLCVIIVRLAPMAIFLRSWSVVFPSLHTYLAHPASTVRQMASKVFLQLAAKGREHDYTPLLPWVLKGLAINWPVDHDFYANPALTGDDEQQQQQQREEGGDAAGGRAAEWSWEGQEGCLLTYELLFNFLLTSHRKRLHPFASLTSSSSSSKSHGRQRRQSHSSVASSGSDLAKLSASAFGSKDSVGSTGAGTPAGGASTPNRGQGQGSGSGSVQTPAAHPSPWLSPSKLSPDLGGASPSNSRSTPAGGSSSSSGSSSSQKRGKRTHKSLLDALRLSDLEIGAATIAGVPIDSYEHGDIPDGRHLHMAQTLRRVMLQTKGCLAESKFELRRMADQVLPLFTAVVMWYDTRLIQELWATLPRFITARDSKSCLMAARALSVILRRVRQLQLNVGSSPTKRSRSRAHPPSPAVPPRKLFADEAKDSSAPPPSPSPSPSPELAAEAAADAGVGVVSVLATVDDRRRRVMHTVAQIEGLLPLLFEALQALAAFAPSDSVLVMGCELLVILQAYYGFGGAADAETTLAADMVAAAAAGGGTPSSASHAASATVHVFNRLWRQHHNVRLVANRLARVLALANPRDALLCVPPEMPEFMGQWKLRRGVTTPSPERSSSRGPAVSPVTGTGDGPGSSPRAAVVLAAAKAAAAAPVQPSAVAAVAADTRARLAVEVGTPRSGAGASPGQHARPLSWGAATTPMTLGSTSSFSVRTLSTPGTGGKVSSVNPTRRRRAAALQQNLASALAPLMPDLVSISTLGEVVAVLPAMLQWILAYDEEKLRLSLLDAVTRAVDAAVQAAPLPCGMILTPDAAGDVVGEGEAGEESLPAAVFDAVRNLHDELWLPHTPPFVLAPDIAALHRDRDAPFTVAAASAADLPGASPSPSSSAAAQQHAWPPAVADVRDVAAASATLQCPVLRMSKPQPTPVVLTTRRVHSCLTLITLRLVELLQVPSMEAPVLKATLDILTEVCSASLSPSLLRLVLRGTAQRCRSQVPASVLAPAAVAAAAVAPPAGEPGIASPHRQVVTVDTRSALRSFHSFRQDSVHAPPTATSSASGFTLEHVAASDSDGSGAEGQGSGGEEEDEVVVVTTAAELGVDLEAAVVAATAASSPHTPPRSGCSAQLRTAATPPPPPPPPPPPSREASTPSPPAGKRAFASALVPLNINHMRPHHIPSPIRMTGRSPGTTPSAEASGQPLLWHGPSPSASRLKLAKSATRPKALSLEEDALEVQAMADAAAAAGARRRSARSLGDIREHEVEDHRHPASGDAADGSAAAIEEGNGQSTESEEEEGGSDWDDWDDWDEEEDDNEDTAAIVKSLAEFLHSLGLLVDTRWAAIAVECHEPLALGRPQGSETPLQRNGYFANVAAFLGAEDRAVLEWVMGQYKVGL